MTTLSDALAARTELAQFIAGTHKAQHLVEEGDETSKPMEGWEAHEDLAESLITEGWVLGRPGSIPESAELGSVEYLSPGPMTLLPMLPHPDNMTLPTSDEVVDRIQRLLTGVQLDVAQANTILRLVGSRTTGTAAGDFGPRTITFDLDTGDAVDGGNRSATGPIWDRIASHGLAGMTPELVGEMHGAYLEERTPRHPWDTAPDVFDEMRQEHAHARERYSVEHDAGHGVSHLVVEAVSRLTHTGEVSSPDAVRHGYVQAGGLIGAAIQAHDEAQGRLASPPVAPEHIGRIPMPGEPRRM